MQSTTAKLSILSPSEVVFELSDGHAALGNVRLSVADVDSLIAKLALQRATLAPPVPRVQPDLSAVGLVPDPIWILRAAGSTPDKLLLIRHPGLGWLMFQLPPAQAAKLGRGLLSGEPQPTADRLSPNRPLH
jgi:hypothetical protein